jgi:oxygen-independent coproporphyrinogen-3 oxidase
MDLIHGLPGRTRQHWFAQLRRALALQPEHLSCYSLTFEPGTPLHAEREAGVYPGPDEEEDRALLLDTLAFLDRRGYPFYEVSNFSRDGRFPSRHNLRYWMRSPYLGFGPGAHSFTSARRRWNPSSVHAYLGADDGILENGADAETLSPAQEALEMLALGLRTARGMNLVSYRARLTEEDREKVDALIETLVRRNLALPAEDHLRLTPQGLAVADSLPALFPLPNP